VAIDWLFTKPEMAKAEVGTMEAPGQGTRFGLVGEALTK
jgi:hypothetical protein